MDGWMGGKVGGWMDGEAGLRIAYSNKKFILILTTKFVTVGMFFKLVHSSNVLAIILMTTTLKKDVLIFSKKTFLTCVTAIA